MALDYTSDMRLVFDLRNISRGKENGRKDNPF
jgi:hypothetical protein